jgi:hypothetical protein
MITDWKIAIEHEVAKSKHERWRALCDESHPNHKNNRDHVLKMANGWKPESPQYPSAIKQVGNALGAAGRAIAAVATGQPVFVPDSVYSEREATCRTCEKYDAAQRRCSLCGCKTQVKLRAAQEECPLPVPLWSKYNPS